jgi:hypothetical protein
MAATTTFDVEQAWRGPINFQRRRWPASATVLEEPPMSPAGFEIIADPWWSQKIQRGLGDSATGRVRTLQEHVDSD